MILWTLQSHETWTRLQSRGRVRGRWRNVKRTTFEKPYRWMASEMVRRGLMHRPLPPIWAWHSCGGVGRAPDEDTMFMLCGGNEAAGVILELDAPELLVLLSDYGVWNDLIEMLMSERIPDDAELTPDSRLFHVSLINRPPRWEDNGDDVRPVCHTLRSHGFEASSPCVWMKPGATCFSERRHALPTPRSHRIESSVKPTLAIPHVLSSVTPRRPTCSAIRSVAIT